jgi:hypothetical protein
MIGAYVAKKFDNISVMEVKGVPSQTNYYSIVAPSLWY